MLMGTGGSMYGMRLRGGEPSEADDGMSKELDDVLADIQSMKEEFMQDHAEMEGEPKFMGFSRNLLPMTDKPNGPVMRNDFYEGDQFDDSSADSQDRHNMERWAPSYEDMDEALKMLEDSRQYLDEMSPEGIDRFCKENGAEIEDLRPITNSMGTRVGNLTKMQEVRERALGKIEDIRFSHDLLRHHMDNPRVSGVQELEKELASMTMADVNPAVGLLHEWLKNKKHEHESGEFMKQHEERQSKGATNALPVPSMPIPAPSVPLEVPGNIASSRRS